MPTVILYHPGVGQVQFPGDPGLTRFGIRGPPEPPGRPNHIALVTLGPVHYRTLFIVPGPVLRELVQEGPGRNGRVREGPGGAVMIWLIIGMIRVCPRRF